MMTRAVRKYGKNAFSVDVIEECTPETVDERERFWIAQLRTRESEFGYNCEDSGNACKTLSTETKKKIGDSRRKWWASLTQAERDTFNALRRGPYNLTDEQRQHASNIRKGVPKSPEHRAKIAASKLARGKHPKGCKCGSHGPSPKRRLTNEQVIEIQRLRKDGIDCYELATRFHVSTSTIRRACSHAFYTTPNTTPAHDL